MKKIFSIVFILAFGMFFPACKQDDPTVIEGTVRDRKTDELIENATIVYRKGHYGNDSDYEEGQANTHKNGQYRIEIPGEFTEVSHVECWTSAGGGTLSAYKPNVTKIHQVNEWNPFLTRLDGLLQLNFSNQTGQHDSVFFKIAHKEFYEFPSNVWHNSGLSVGIGETVTQIFKMPSDDYARIYWGNKFFEKLASTYSDSIWIGKDSTTVYYISF